MKSIFDELIRFIDFIFNSINLYNFLLLIFGNIAICKTIKRKNKKMTNVEHKHDCEMQNAYQDLIERSRCYRTPENVFQHKHGMIHYNIKF